MTCSIKTNDKNNIVEVLTPTGQKSILFEELNSIPFLGDTKSNLRYLAPAYSESIQKIFEGAQKYVYETGEPKLFFMTANNKEYETIEDVVINDEPGLTKVGFKNPKTDEFIEVLSFDTKKDDTMYFLYDQIGQGILSPKRVLDQDGVLNLQGKGLSPEMREAQAYIFKREALVNGYGNVKTNNNGDIKIEFPENTVKGIVGGKVQIINIDSVPEEIKKTKFDNERELLHTYNEKNNLYRTKKQDSKPSINNGVALRASMNRFLESIGFTKTTIEAYKKNYKTRFDSDPDVNVLADMANKVIASVDGTISTDELTEEVAHIAVEAYSDQVSITEALVNVIYTPEYKEFSEYYRQRYSSLYDGVELEDAVRKEVLGKILAKEFKNKFQTQPATEEQGIVLDFLRNLWNRLVEYFRGNIQNQHRRVLDDLTKKIAENVIANEASQFQQDLKQSKMILFNATSKEALDIESQLKIARGIIESAFRQFKERVPRAKELEKITKELDENESLSSVNVIIDVARQQLNTIESNIKQADANNQTIEPRDETIYNVISGNLLKTLNSIKTELSKKVVALNKEIQEEKDEKKKSILQSKKVIVERFIRDIDQLNIRKSNLDPIVDRDKERLAMEHVEVLYGKDSNMTEEQRAAEMAKVEGGYRDRSIFATYLGINSASKNPVIKAMYWMVSKMRSKVNLIFKNTFDTELKDIYSKDYHKYQTNLIKKKDGKNTHYFLSPIDWEKYHADQYEYQLQKLIQYTGRDQKELEKLIPLKSFRDIIITNKTNKDQIKAYNDFIKDIKEFDRNSKHQARTEQYYKDRDERYKKINISESTQETIANLNARVFAVTSKAMNKDGTIDKSKLSEGDKVTLAGIKKDREAIKSPYDNFGNLRVGLRLIKASEVTEEDLKSLPYADYLRNSDYKGDVVVLVNGYKIEDLEEDSRVAFDMNNMSMYYLQEVQGKDRSKVPVESFLETMEKSNNPFEWMMDNSTITLSEDYYENTGEYKSFVDKVSEYIDTLDNKDDIETLRSMLEEFERASRKRRNILKRYKRSNNPLEIDVMNMSIEAKEAIIELDKDVADWRRSLLNNILVEEEEITEGEQKTVKELNEDFYSNLEESGKSVFDFALSHMTAYNKIRVEKFGLQLDALFNGTRPYLDSQYENFFQEKLDDDTITPDMSPDAVRILLKDEYAKKYVASYYQRYSPVGYDQLMEALKNGNVSARDLMEKNPDVLNKYTAAKYLEISPDYSWIKDISNEEYVNKNYKKGGYFIKPNDKYLDMEFFNRYGISVDAYKALETDDISQLKATNNVEEFELYKKMISLREKSLELYDDLERVNKYQLVQKSKDSFEKVFSLSSVKSPKATIKDVFKDIIQNRPDELDYGAQIEGEDVSKVGSGIDHRVIPKYYQEKLEDADVITENIIEAGFLDYWQAISYSEKKKVERDLLALEYKIKQQEFINNGGSVIKGKLMKGGETSNYFKSGQELLNHHLYGIQQTRAYKMQVLGKEVDLMHVLSKVQGFAQFSNLAYNLFVDATGATTGIINNIIDKHTGDYYHKSSSNLARSQVLSYMPEYAAEIGKPNKTSKMSALLETFGLIEPNSKVEGSKYGYFGRLLKRSPYLASKASNLIIAPRILFSILNDYRFVDGKFRSFNEFKTMKKVQDNITDVKAVEALWAKYAEDSLMNNLDIKESLISPNELFKSKYTGNFQEAFDDIVATASTKAQHVLQNVDGVMTDADRVAATRDAMTNLFMQHKGWLAIFIAKRFKSRGYNVATGQVEEGHYTTFLSTLESFMKFARSKGISEGTKEWWGNVEDFEKRNLKRALIETSIASALVYIFGAMVLAGDDEDDTWVEDFARLVYLRTTSEFRSTQLTGIPAVIQETYKSPIASVGTLEAVYSLTLGGGLFKTDPEYGLKAFRKAVKGSILKRYEQYTDLDHMIQTFRHFNTETLGALGEMKDADEAKFIEAWSIGLQD